MDKALLVLRRILPYLGVAIAIGLLYDAWVFYSRWDSARRTERARTAKETENARRTTALLGSGELKIYSFYTPNSVIHPGEKTTICYGVGGAKTVRIEPPVGDIYPALTRCLEAAPRKDTEYKLTAEDGAGHKESASFVIRVIR